MHRLFIGIDNGVTGTIGILGESAPAFMETPVKKEQNYTKKKDLITRIDSVALRDIIAGAMQGLRPDEVIVGMERPMFNPERYNATVSAARAFEAQLCVIESLGLPLVYMDSREWQRELLPQGVSGSELKKASRDIASRLFPGLSEGISHHGDGDGILIAEHMRRRNY